MLVFPEKPSLSVINPLYLIIVTAACHIRKLTAVDIHRDLPMICKSPWSAKVGVAPDRSYESIFPRREQGAGLTTNDQ